MKILFINSRSPDYIEDQLFSGLTELLGKESVTAYPVNSYFYYERKAYPRNMGKCRSIGDFILDKLTLGKELKAFEYDLVVIGSTKRDTFENFMEITPYLPKHIPVVFVDGGDFPDIGGDARRLGFETLYREVADNYKFKAIFKREYLVAERYPDNAFPLPMSYKPQPIELPIDKQYEVTCWCVESDPVRTRALAILENLYDCRANGTTRGQTFRNYKRKGLGYLKELGSSRIACNFRGVGWDTLRYWEIPAVQSLMVSQKPQIVILDNFVHGEHVLFCKDDLSDLTALLDYYLAHNDEAEALAAAGREHLLKHHTNIRRAEFFLENIKD
ncbi:MAG: glycosyltransferase [Gammaproteobacteria bacterium]|nr:glycosyltransferase [Gammaproteobacteria bacterium]